MGGTFGQWRVLVAMLISTLLIGGAFVLAHMGDASPPVAQASQESDLLAAVATRDSTGDGLPDWQKALYGIPLNATTTDYFHLGMTDAEAVAKGLIVPKAIADVPEAGSSGTMVNPDLPPAPAEGTLTAAFSKNVFTLYLNALQSSGGNLSDSDLTNIANQALTQLGDSVNVAPPFKSLNDLKVAGSGPDAMKAFVVAADAVMNANTTTATKSEIFYLQDAVENNDSSALDQIRSLAKLYRSVAAGLAELPVPKELAADDLALINAFARMGEATNDFALVNSDPLATMLALHQYPDDVLALGNGFIHIMDDFKAAGITFAPGEKGGAFVNVINDILAEQQAAQSANKSP